ncbi:aspartate carbamoyltransferase catalytic subunit [Salibacterium salarium]|uniref:Aspartate carbamoyltransferase n=1 Tax=Salibacterium salarium TaxID=284579 RepID=A0A3R9Q109_9BACI|nr:aspartate carbamoyltransferase catalytic subunit [Salibacterium salarium]RSL31329.1 aspartate carbamoyltransferase catalytic subunit [Salibacterium salarium]
MRPEHVLTMEDWGREEIHELLDKAQDFANHPSKLPSQRIYAANLFFEPSTRTKISFEAAERNLGLDLLHFEADTSSVKKGETLYDTVKTLESIGADVVVIRHGKERYFDELRNHINIPIINGGDGCGHHPTQSFLDLLTIKQEFGMFDGINVVIAGDIFHSRVARSNLEVLERLGANVFVSGPKEWMSEELMERYVPMDEAVEFADVMMMLRIQHERHAVKMVAGPQKYHEQYGLNEEKAQRMKPTSIIMHPAPINRNVEIADALVECGRSRIFKQMKNGVFVRMAVLSHVLENQQGGLLR